VTAIPSVFAYRIGLLMFLKSSRPFCDCCAACASPDMHLAFLLPAGLYISISVSFAKAGLSNITFQKFDLIIITGFEPSIALHINI
jgi:hypothetical protein